MAREEGATAVAHGCTGKGNDQVRFDVSVQALAPRPRDRRPGARVGMVRDEEIEYAEKHGIPVPATEGEPVLDRREPVGTKHRGGHARGPVGRSRPRRSTSGRSHPFGLARRAGVLRDRASIEGTPDALDGEEIDGVELVTRLNSLAGRHGVGRIDHVEDRLIGIKSREIYEAPAAVTLLEAHKALEHMTLSRQQIAFKKQAAQGIRRPHLQRALVHRAPPGPRRLRRSTQRHVTGHRACAVAPGPCDCCGPQGDHSLYDYSLATYDRGDTYDQSASVGFIKVFGLPARVQARTQLLKQPEGPLQIAHPKEDA